MKRFMTGILLTIALAIMAVPGFGQQTAGTNLAAFNASYAAPALSGVGTAVLTYTAGTIYKGGTSVSISASTSGSFGATKNNCDAPAYTACEIVYWTSGTGLSHTTAPATAFAANNIVVAFVTTDGSNNITAITPASLDLPMQPAYYIDCISSASCAAPTTINGAAYHVAGGSATLVGGTVTITGLTGFTQNATTNAFNFGCFAVFDATTSTAGAQSISCVPQSASSVKITVGSSASATDVIRWEVRGYFVDPAHDGLWADVEEYSGIIPRLQHRDRFIN